MGVRPYKLRESTVQRRLCGNTKEQFISLLSVSPARCVWDKGVRQYALDIVTSIDGEQPITKEVALRGARDWIEYSYKGLALINKEDIIERLCSKDDLASRKGVTVPKFFDSFLEMQGRALECAWYMIEKYRYLSISELKSSGGE